MDDVAFIRPLLDYLTANYTVDRRRVFATGFSDGASMALRVGAELSDQFAAIAPEHFALLWHGHGGQVEPAQRRPAPDGIGKSINKLNAPDVIWSFFSRHPAP